MYSDSDFPSVSVAAVGVNNAVNAALQAAKHLAVHNDDIRMRLEEYLDRASDESLENDRRLNEESAE